MARRCHSPIGRQGRYVPGSGCHSQTLANPGRGRMFHSPAAYQSAQPAVTTSQSRALCSPPSRQTSQTIEAAASDVGPAVLSPSLPLLDKPAALLGRTGPVLNRPPSTRLDPGSISLQESRLANFPLSLLYLSRSSTQSCPSASPPASAAVSD